MALEAPLSEDFHNLMPERQKKLTCFSPNRPQEKTRPFGCSLCSLLLFFLNLATLPVWAQKPEQSQAERQKTLKQRLEAKVQDFLRDPATLAPGLQIGVITPQGKSYLAWGSLWHGKDVPPQPDTLYELASLTKPFTALLLAQLFVEGQVKLNDPVKPCSPTETSVWCFRGQPLTWLDLLTHSSGLPSLPENLDLGDPQATRRYSPQDLAAFEQGFKRTVPAPTDFGYSTLGYGLLGQLLAEKTGLSFASQIEDLTARLGLPDTRLQLSSEQFQRLAPGYIRTQLVPYFADEGGLSASGGLKSTPRDLLDFLAQILQIEQAPSSPLLVKTLAQTTQLTGRRGAPFCQMAWGWQYFTPAGVYWHSGSAAGGKAFLAFEPQRQIGVVILSNARVQGFKMEPLGLHVLELLGEMEPNK
ncbi:MAG: beta-lactamase family protein [Candidatus Sericytochromatia bacterium]|nr:beta-lactamase family protein [Candidatus Sericytochromatia bacterium]